MTSSSKITDTLKQSLSAASVATLKTGRFMINCGLTESIKTFLNHMLINVPNLFSICREARDDDPNVLTLITYTIKGSRTHVGVRFFNPTENWSIEKAIEETNDLLIKEAKSIHPEDLLISNQLEWFIQFITLDSHHIINHVGEEPIVHTAYTHNLMRALFKNVDVLVAINKVDEKDSGIIYHSFLGEYKLNSDCLTVTGIEKETH